MQICSVMEKISVAMEEEQLLIARLVSVSHFLTPLDRALLLSLPTVSMLIWMEGVAASAAMLKPTHQFT